MNIGIYDINLSSNLNYEERLKIYKNCRFNEIAFYLDDNYQYNFENYMDIYNFAKKIDLKICQVHLDYKNSNLICNENSIFFDYLYEKLKECEKLEIPYLIFHASKGEKSPKIGEKSLLKLRKIMKEFENKNVYVCFENVRENFNLEKILNAKINNIKMCFDIGHANCYSKNENLINKYKNQIYCAHLHNNFGVDTHNRLKNGEIDVKKIYSKLKNTMVKSACLEVFPEKDKILNKTEFENFVSLCFEDCKILQ